MPNFSAVENTAWSFWLPHGAAMYLAPDRPALKTLSAKGNWNLVSEGAIT